MYETPAQVWSRLAGIRQPVLERAERYAALTIPKLCLPEGHQQYSDSQANDFQSLGAQAVNHLANRLMMALFRPGDPFFRLDPGKDLRKKLAAANIKEEDLQVLLSDAELEAVNSLDRKSLRQKFYQASRHLITIGNVVVQRGKGNEPSRVYGLRNFCVKRMANGMLHTLAIAEKVKFDELDPAAQSQVSGRQMDSEVTLYRVICREPAGNYKLRYAVDEVELLDPKFTGNYASLESLEKEYLVLGWDLADEHDYATGLVEEYEDDFMALSALSESLLDGSVLTTEMRWLVNPAGMTAIEDFRRSRNGDAMPGIEGDLAAVSGGDPKAIEAAIRVIEIYSQRLARGFLLQSAMVRDAERVTAEEIRAIAMELETAFGGVYSQLGNGWQRPVAHWCLEDVDLGLPPGADIQVTVITGLEALSRNAQLEKLRAALGDLALFEQLPDAMKARFNYDSIVKFVGMGRGINLSPHLKSEEQVRAEQQQAMNDQVSTETGIAAGTAAAQAAANPGAIPA